MFSSVIAARAKYSFVMLLPVEPAHQILRERQAQRGAEFSGSASARGYVVVSHARQLAMVIL